MIRMKRTYIILKENEFWPKFEESVHAMHVCLADNPGNWNTKGLIRGLGKEWQGNDYRKDLNISFKFS